MSHRQSSGAAGEKFKCADARSKFKKFSHRQSSGAAGEKFKCADARSKFKSFHTDKAAELLVKSSNALTRVQSSKVFTQTKQRSCW